MSSLPLKHRGRVVRTSIGVLLLALLGWSLAGLALGPLELGGTDMFALLAFFGVSFVLQGMMANPGCEVTAIPNLLLRPFRRQVEVP